MAGTPAGAAELAEVAQVVGGTVTGPQWHADTVREAHAHAMNAHAADVPPGSAEAIRRYEAEMEQALVALAERADTLERERDSLQAILTTRTFSMTESGSELVAEARAEADRLREAIKYAVRMLNDPDEHEIGEVIDRIEQAAGALRAALAGPQTVEQP